MPHYQPIIDLASGHLLGVEALARWQHPDRGLLGPAEFLPVAEQSNLIVRIGEIMLLASCHAGRRWTRHLNETEPFTISVNLAPQQIAQPDLVEVVGRCLADSHLPPHRLVLEVTETAVMADLDAATSSLQHLRDLGVGLALDDFGTGYSSLTYLKRFPLTAVKIDRTFVAGVCTDADDHSIVSSVLRLAESIGLSCVAEGVETAEQASILRYLGCTGGQGWFFAHAMSEPDLNTWLAAPRPPMPSELSAPAAGTAAAPQPPSTAGATAFAAAPAVIRRILALQADGASLHTIAAALNAEGLTLPGGRRWHWRSVARALSDQPS